jgi:hypothetical protein
MIAMTDQAVGMFLPRVVTTLFLSKIPGISCLSGNVGAASGFGFNAVNG